MKVIDWLIGKGNRPINRCEIPINISVEHEIAKSIVTRQELAKLISKRYPLLIADLLVPYDDGDKENDSQ